MTDNLRQVGKYIGKTGRDADRALKRPYPIQPRLERIRDVFDSSLAFEMSFTTQVNDERVLLDLFFKLPPPSRGCKSGCIHTKCEEFTFESGGNHAVTVDFPYEAGMISVFVNGDKLPDGQVSEVNPGAGEVFFQGTEGPDTVAICYIYLVDCRGDAGFPECPALAPSFLGGTLVFSDRMDRSRSVETYGGVGAWFNGGITYTPIAVDNTGGSLSLASTKFFFFENLQASSIFFEAIYALDLTFAGATFGFNAVLNTASLAFNHAGVVTVGYYTQLYPTNPASTTVSNQGSAFSQATAYTTVNLRQKIYVRFMFASTIYQVKIWPQNEEEPTAWMDFIPTPPAGGGGYSVGAHNPGNFVSGSVQGSGINLTAIEIWGSQSPIYGSWSHEGESSNSWSRTSQHNGMEQSGLIHIIDGPTGVTLTENAVGSFVQMHDIGPSFDMVFTWPQFDNTVGYFFNATQRVLSFTNNIGKSQTVKITGEVSLVLGLPNAPHHSVPSLRVALNSYNYDEGTPTGTGDVINGTIQSVVEVPHDGTVGGIQGWVPFEIEIPVTAGGRFQWGAHIIENGFDIAPQLGDNVGSFFIGLHLEMGIQFRWLIVKSTVVPLGGAAPFCPTGPLLDRCNQLIEGFIGPTYDYVEDFMPATGFVTGSGNSWTIAQNEGTRTEFNGSYRTEFRAAGVTEDGSDGRDTWYRGEFSAGRSVSDTNAVITTSNNPLACGPASISFQFTLGSLGSDFYITSTAVDWEDSLGEHRYPVAYISISGLIMEFSNDPDFNYIRISGGPVQYMTWQANTSYNFYMEVTATNVAAKVWRVGDAEPSWTITRAVTNQGGLGISFQIDHGYFDFINDNFFIETSNLAISSQEAAF